MGRSPADGNRYLAERAVYNHRRRLQRHGLPLPGCIQADNTCVGRIEAHHPDYSKPNEFVFLCARHHKLIDGQRRWAETCKYGHSLTPDNLYHPPSRPGGRGVCRKCRNTRAENSRQLRRLFG